MKDGNRVDPDRMVGGEEPREAEGGEAPITAYYVRKKYFLNLCFSHTMHLFSIKGENKF